MARLLMCRGTPLAKSWMAAFTESSNSFESPPAWAELEVNVAASLLAGQWSQLVADRDAIKQVGMLRPPQNGAERFLADEQKFQRRPHVQRGTDQQPQVGQGVAVQEVGFVEDQQQGTLGPRGPFQDLFVNAFFAASRRFPQLGDDQL